MPKHAALLLGALSLGFAPVLLPKPAKPDPNQEDLKRLQGTWVCVSESVGGVPTPPGRLQAVITGDRLTFYREGRATKGWTVTLDAKAKPKSLDLDMAAGPSKAMIRAVYALTGDTLTICWGTDGKRPTDLSGKAPTHNLKVYKRMKP